MVEVVPPTLKSLTTSTSPFLWKLGEPLKLWPPPLLVLPRVILFWKNQKPFCASPALSNRSMPKKMTLQVEVLDGHVVLFVARVYRAAKPFRRMSFPGKPPLAWFQAQLETSIG